MSPHIRILILSFRSIAAEDWRRFRQLMSETQKTDHRVDLEIMLNGDASFHWREFEAPGTQLLFKGNRSVWMGDKSDVEALLDD